jgi:hypothetical protein
MQLECRFFSAGTNTVLIPYGPESRKEVFRLKASICESLDKKGLRFQNLDLESDEPPGEPGSARAAAAVRL